MHEPENESAASHTDKSSGEDSEESLEWEPEVDHVRGNRTGESTQSPDPEINVEASDNGLFEDILDYSPMSVDDQVRAL